MMLNKSVTPWVILLLLWSLPVLPAWAQIDCKTLKHWVTLDDNQKFNQHHVFCGELNRNRSKGFHARPGGDNPETVTKFVVQDQPNSAGIYTGRWTHKYNPYQNKFSSMFPDSCTAEQVINSIAYAIEHPSQCPSDAPDWTECGPNKPRKKTASDDGDDTYYCSQNDRLFTIGYAPSRYGKINTAFPIYE